MTDKIRLNVGDLVVRHGKVLKVFQIDQDTIDLQPFFNFQASNGLTFTLMTKNAHDGHIRPLASKAEIKRLMNLIIKTSADETSPPAFDIKTALTINQFQDTLWIIKILWLEKQKKIRHTS